MNTGWDELYKERVLTAAFRDGQWTVIDRDSGVQIGGFGLPAYYDTFEEALEEAERFGSKWGWPVDRETSELLAARL